jgi:hypothetical protein
MSLTPDPTQDITRYAEILAHVRHYPPDRHAEVIARLGVRRRDWDAASAKWRQVRDAERFSGQLDATVRFGRVLADTRAALAARKPPIELLGPLPGPDGDLAAQPVAPQAAAPPPLPAAPAPEAPAVQVPSFLAPSPQAPEPLPLPVSPPPALAFTMPLGAALPIGPSTPFIASAGSSSEAFDRAVAHAEAVQGPAAAARPAMSTGTVALGPEATAPAPPPGVADLTLQQYASLRVELHQHPEQAAAILGRYGVAATTRPALEAHWRSRFDADPGLKNAFAGAYASYVAWLGRERVAALPPVVRAPEKIAGTVEADLSSIIAAVERGALPFAGAPAPAAVEIDLARYPLELYAALTGAIARGAPREQVLPGHGLTPAAFEALARAWGARFAGEPELLLRFQALARGGGRSE